MDALEVAEEDDQDRQANRRLCCSDSQDEEDENLSGEILQEMRKGNEVHVDRKQHQFDGHQQDQQIFPIEENANDADCEEHRAQNQEV